MKELLLMVGPPGSGKSTLARKLRDEEGYTYINQDSQGADHSQLFIDAVYAGNEKIVVDRMNFNIQQRRKYIEIAKLNGYEVDVIIKCEPAAVCFERMMARTDHETIQDERSARGAMQTFFTKYEPPTEAEGIRNITRIYPDTLKQLAIYSDLDGTLCDVEHRRHFVRPNDPKPEGFKKNWKAFFEGIKDDPVNEPVMLVLKHMARQYAIVYCTGRDDNYRRVTLDWLKEHGAPEGPLYMRHRNDSRADYLVKEILLDFEVLTRYKIIFALDDRDQVVNMLRRRGITVFQVAEGDF